MRLTRRFKYVRPICAYLETPHFSRIFRVYITNLLRGTTVQRERDQKDNSTEFKNEGLNWDLNPGPLTIVEPKARILPLNYPAAYKFVVLIL